MGWGGRCAAVPPLRRTRRPAPAGCRWTACGRRPSGARAAARGGHALYARDAGPRAGARGASELEAAIEFCLVAWYMISMICSHMIIY